MPQKLVKYLTATTLNISAHIYTSPNLDGQCLFLASHSKQLLLHGSTISVGGGLWKVDTFLIIVHIQ